MNTNAVPKTHKVRKGIASVIMNVILIIFSLSCIFPIVWMAYSSLKEKRVFNADIMGLPKNPTLINYIKILSNKDYHLGQSMMNSVRTTVISIVLIIIFSFIVGYILARVHFKLNRILYVMFLMGMLIPIHSLLVPIYVVFQRCGINNRWFTLLLPYVSFGLPIGIFLVEGYVKTIPVSLEEAAAIDGAGLLKTMFIIMMPLCKPILSTVVILTFMHVWNEFAFAQVLISQESLKTIPIGLTYFTSQYMTSYTLLLAALAMATLPVLVIYLFFYNKIMEGMMAGAVKG